MLNFPKTAIAAMVLVATMTASPIVGVSPASAGGKNWQGNWNRGNWNHHGNWNHGNWNYSPNYWVAPAIGLGTGLVFGAILAQPLYNAPGYAPQPRYGSGYRGNSPYSARCSEAMAQHGENSAEAQTFC